MCNNPLVSVVIPNYNYAKTLPSCFEALEKQTYKNIEIIFVDDGSTDDSVQIASNFPCKVIVTPVNKGVSAVRNLGASHASGEIIFFLDSDVALFEDAIENTVKEFSKDSSLGSVCGIYAKEPLFNDSLVEEYRILQGHYWRISSEGYVTASFVSLGAIKKSVFIEIGGFNENLDNSEDIELGHRLNLKYNLLLTSKVQGYHDDEYKMKTLCRKMFERARQRIPFYFYRKSFTKGFETPKRAVGLFFVGLSCLMLPLLLLLPGLATVLGLLGCLTMFLISDFGQYRFVNKERGFAFTLFFYGVHWVVSAVTFWGFVKGFIDFIFSKKFRLKYKY